MRATKAEKAAYDVLYRLGIRRPPVPVERIANQLDVEVVEQPLDDDVSGMIYRRHPRPLILVNSKQHEHRKRFSIAHELGHHILHQDDRIFVDSRMRRDSVSALGIDLKEIDANQFAASLLMPRDWIVAAVNQQRSTGRPAKEKILIDNLARLFNVSPLAMELRLANLGILPTY